MVELISETRKKLRSIAKKRISILRKLKSQKYLLLMMIPGAATLILIHYGPLYGIIIAFKEYNPGIGIWRSPWADPFWKYFKELFTDIYFLNALRNTLATSALKLVVGFPIPIIFALCLNEIRLMLYKRTIQTLSYMPYFLSWAFVASFLISFLSDSGTMNTILLSLGIIEQPASFLGRPFSFVMVILFSYIWKGFGFSSIIYLAVITSINPQMFETATIDGASRWQKIWYISIPTIMPTVVVLLILSISGIINANFEQFFLLQNQLVKDWARVINVYTYEVGFTMGRFSYGTAVGLFTSITSLFLLVAANNTARKFSGHSIY